MNFQVELNSVCNLRCAECATVQQQRKKEFMTDEVFDAILYKYIVPYKDVNTQKNGRPTFIGHKDGEPLLNKKLLDIWRKVSNACPDMNIDLYTHGLLLPKWAARGQDIVDFLGSLPNRCRMLISFHFNNFDGTTNDYTEATPFIREAIRRRPKNVEIILVSHLVAPQTRESLTAWRETWQPEIEAGISVHANASINPWTGRIDDPNVSKFNGCPYGDFGHWFFGVTGNIIACCLDLEEEIVLGNVMRDDPAKMFEKTKEFYAEQQRIQQDKSRLKHQVCANCFGLERVPALQQLGVMDEADKGVTECRVS